MSFQIYCPKPSRQVKRKLLEEYNHCDAPPAKRQLCCPFQDYSMETRKESRQAMSPPLLRPATVPGTSNRENSAITQRSATVTPLRGVYVSLPDETSQALASPSSVYDTDPQTPATSFEACLSYGPDRSRVASPQHPSYRTDLYYNGIEIEPTDPRLDITGFGQNVLQRDRASPQMSPDQQEHVRKALRSLKDSDEDTIKLGFISSGIIPGITRHPDLINLSCNIPMNPTAVPHIAGQRYLPAPKPDIHFSFNDRAFTAEEHRKQSGTMLGLHSKPSHGGSWPFFTVEFKSLAKGGTSWVAENQNAGSGALCVNGMERLIRTVQTEHALVSSISFSCNIDNRNTALWIHYCHNQRFYSTMLKQYNMTDGSDIAMFSTAIKNVNDFGLDRLRSIKEYLAKITVAEVDQHEKKQKARRPYPDNVPKRRRSSSTYVEPEEFSVGSSVP